MTGEETQMERYRLSFTVGGLLVPQSVITARVFLETVENAQKNEPVALMEALTATSDAKKRSLGALWKAARRQVIDESLLPIRTQSAMSRTVSEVIKRLETLSPTELRFLTADDSMNADRAALMWVAMCRYYTLVGEFANGVLRDHYLLGKPTVTYDDYDRFAYSKSLWHAELDEISPATAKKLRANLFQAMFEGRLLEKEGNLIVPSLLGSRLTDVLRKKPESFLFFPMRDQAQSGNGNIDIQRTD